MYDYDINTFKVYLNDSEEALVSGNDGFEISWNDNHFDITFDFEKLGEVKTLKLRPADRPCWVTIDRQESDHRVGWKPQKPFMRSGLKNLYMSSNPEMVMDTMSVNDLKIVRLGGRVGFLNAENVMNAALTLKDKHENMVRDNALAIKRYHDKLEELKSGGTAKKKESAPEPKEPLTLRKRLGKIKRRILGSGKAAVDSFGKPLIRFETEPIGSVDCFVYLSGRLYSYGWIYDMNSPIKSLYISYYHDGELMASHSCDSEFRKDVAQVINIPEAVDSGFRFDSSIESEFPLQVYVEYVTDIGRGVLFLGNIPGDPQTIGVKLDPPDDPRNMGCITDFIENNTVEYLENDERIYGPAVDIIMPVYNAFEYFDLLFESLGRTRINYKLIMIDDASPDERVYPYLKKYADEHENAVLLQNEHNMGFVKTVNRGLKIAIEDNAHAVLLNTDVEVTDEWLERLITPVITGEKVATSTPFTNSGTTCSFPNFCKDNVIFEGMQAWKIDNVFRFINPKYPHMPTGIGFCMAMNIAALKEVGLLDEETFGKGYGEENDWCQRAIKAGYKNVHADNLFVYHKHGGSFLSEEKKRLIAENSEKLFARYPDYKREVGAFCAIDPAKKERLYAMIRLMSLIPDVKTTIAFDHAIGGGATSYLEQQCKERLEAGEKFLIIRYIGASEEYKLIYRYKKYRVELSDARLSNVLDMINSGDEIWINELYTWPDLENVLDTITRLRDRLDAKIYFKYHDFFSICPAVTLVDNNYRYCDIAESSACDLCVANNENALCGGFMNTASFRRAWRKFLAKCEMITVFSNSSKEILHRAYPELENIEVRPHTTTPLPKPDMGPKKTDTFNIGILGAINENKGRLIIDDCLEEIRKTGRKDHIVVIGYTNKEYDDDAITITGKYKRDQVDKLIEENDIDVFMIPSIWPETFSYTSSEIMSIDMPLAVFDIGAPPERVKDYEKGLIIPEYTGPKDLLDALEALGDRFKR